MMTLANFWTGFWSVLFILTCVLLIVVVLLQKGRGGGLGAALGGAGSSAFGTRTGDVFTVVTIVLAGVFLLLALLTGVVVRPATGDLPSPAILPPSQPISEPITVRLETPIVPGTQIHYTLDGSEPSEKSPAIASGNTIDVPPGSHVRAMSVRPGWKTSSVTAVGEGLYPVATEEDPNAPAQVDAPGLPDRTDANRPEAPADANTPAEPNAAAVNP